MKLDPAVLANLTVALTPKAYIRVTPMAYAATPLGAGYGKTRFASPIDAFRVVYLAEDLTTGVAETLVRDRFQGKTRRMMVSSEVALWGATEVSAATPFTLVDLRTTGLIRLGVSTDAARGKAQDQGRKLSQAIHEQTDAAGLLYLSRLTGRICICLYERVLPGSLIASPLTPLARLADFVPALLALNVELIATH